MTVAPQVPVGAEASGQRRIYVQAATARFKRCTAAFHSHEVRKAANLFSKAARSCRMQSWLTLESAFKDLAFLETVELEGTKQLAVWTAIQAGVCPFFPTDRELTPDEAQESAVIHYIVAGRLPQTIKGITLGTAAWGASFSSHAIGRHLQRSPGVDLEVSMLQAHRALLNAPAASAGELMNNLSFFVPGGPDGAWWCNAGLYVGRRGSERIFHIRARSYLAKNQLDDRRIERSARLLTPRPDEPSMAGTLLLPWHLRPPTIAANVATHDML